MKAKYYELWHKSLNSYSTVGRVYKAKNKKDAINLSGFEDAVKSVGGNLKDAVVEEFDSTIFNKWNTNYCLNGDLTDGVQRVY
jgi:hypothetical protein